MDRDRDLTPSQRRHLERLHQEHRERSLEATATLDRILLEWRAEDPPVTYAAIAARLGISRGRAHQKCVAAEKRRRIREEEPSRIADSRSSRSGPKA